MARKELYTVPHKAMAPVGTASRVPPDTYIECGAKLNKYFDWHHSS